MYRSYSSFFVFEAQLPLRMFGGGRGWWLPVLEPDKMSAELYSDLTNTNAEQEGFIGLYLSGICLEINVSPRMGWVRWGRVGLTNGRYSLITMTYLIMSLDMSYYISTLYVWKHSTSFVRQVFSTPFFLWSFFLPHGSDGCHRVHMTDGGVCNSGCDSDTTSEGSRVKMDFLLLPLFIDYYVKSSRKLPKAINHTTTCANVQTNIHKCLDSGTNTALFTEQLFLKDNLINK